MKFLGRRARWIVGAVLSVTCIVSTALWAGGSGFGDDDDTGEDEGPSYFGFVRDSKGKTIPNASITATTASGSSFVVQADNMGHYRIPGFSKSVDAKRVQISCSKTGYRLVSRDRRVLRGAPNAPIETNCILAPDVNRPAA